MEQLDFSTLTRILSRMDPSGSVPLIWPRNNFENSQLESNLRRLHAGIIPLTVCMESTASWELHWGHELSSNPPDYIAFTGMAEVKGFFELLNDDVARHLAGNSTIAVLDDCTAEALRERGLRIQVHANSAGVDALVSALIDHSQE